MKRGTFWKSSPYGIRYNKRKQKYELHAGVDFAASKGTPVYAAADGIVNEVSYKNHGYGKSIVLHHGSGIKTRYAHLSKILVEKKQEIVVGDIIGLVGSTGNTRGKFNGCHLHFEVIINNNTQNPLSYISSW